MADVIRFYLDENITGGIAQGLRAKGIDVLTAQEAGRDGARGGGVCGHRSAAPFSRA